MLFGIEWKVYLIACPMVFLAGMIDAIGGGGGLISLPAYMLAGLPIHTALGTNKLSSCGGTLVSLGRFIREGLVNIRLAVPSMAAAMAASAIGARASLMMPDKVLAVVLVCVLPISAFIVLNRKLFGQEVEEVRRPDRRMYITAVLAALIVGLYDGFYGPGAGTFWIIAFTVFARMDIRHANAQTKVINSTTGVTSLLVFIQGGTVLFPLALTAMLFNMLGNYIGTGMMLKNGTKIVRPAIMIVLALLTVKVVTEHLL